MSRQRSPRVLYPLRTWASALQPGHVLVLGSGDMVIVSVTQRDEVVSVVVRPSGSTAAGPSRRGALQGERALTYYARETVLTRPRMAGAGRRPPRPAAITAG